MVEMNAWLARFLDALKETFGNRIYFVGLQGSYGRGEATEQSDIDTVVILDHLSSVDIARYQAMLDHLPHRELICGFFSGKDELLNWEPSDLFQFYYDTSPIMGSLDELLSMLDDEVIKRAIKIGACNIYHGCVHNMLYEKSDDILLGLYKSASFVMQAIAFKQTGRYIRHQADLLQIVPDEDREIVGIFLDMKKGAKIDFHKASQILFEWAKKQIVSTNG